MKLFEQLAATTLPVLHTQKREAEKLFAHGVKSHAAFNNSMKSARREAITAGFDFLQARPAFGHGEWEQQCQLYAREISLRSVRQYMQLADISWRWVLYKNPGAKDITAIRALAIDLVMVSPKPLVELCRELGHLLKFGAYFEADYADRKKRKLLGDGRQIEFPFETIFNSVVQLSRLGKPDFHLLLPEGKDEGEALAELESNLQAALDSVHAARCKITHLQA